MKKLLVLVAILVYLYLLTFYCLPDTPYRFFMGRGSYGQCLYRDMLTGDVYDVLGK